MPKRYEVKAKTHGRWNVGGKVQEIEPGETYMTNEKTAKDMEAAGAAEIVKEHEVGTVPENKAIEPQYAHKVPGSTATQDPNISPDAQPNPKDPITEDALSNPNPGTDDATVTEIKEEKTEVEEPEFTSDAAKAHAQKLNEEGKLSTADLAKVKGTGTDGKITKSDLDKAVK